MSKSQIQGVRNITKSQWKKYWVRFKDLYFNAPMWMPSCDASRLCLNLYRAQKAQDKSQQWQEKLYCVRAEWDLIKAANQ